MAPGGSEVNAYYTVAVEDWFAIEGLDKLRPSNLY